MTMRRALVTGGNRGIGLQTCRNLGAEGMSVLLGSRNVALGDEAAAGLRAEMLSVTAIELDVADPVSITRLAEGLERDGIHVDVLVNNAGVIAPGDLLTGSGDQMTEALDVNLLGPWRMAKAFMPAMAARGWGRVVNVSSAWGSFASGLKGPCRLRHHQGCAQCPDGAPCTRSRRWRQGECRVSGLGEDPHGRRERVPFGCRGRGHGCLARHAAR